MEKTPKHAAAQASCDRMVPGTKHLYGPRLVLRERHGKGFAGAAAQEIGKVQGSASRSGEDVFIPCLFSEHSIA